jgi:hypothetical protein
MMFAAVRSMATLTGDFHISLRIALSGEECRQCHCECEMFVEPVDVCTVCWSILVLNTSVRSLKALL